MRNFFQYFRAISLAALVACPPCDARADTKITANNLSTSGVASVGAATVQIAGAVTSGTNTNSGIVFPAPTPHTGNVFNGLTFNGSGWTNVLKTPTVSLSYAGVLSGLTGLTLGVGTYNVDFSNSSGTFQTTSGAVTIGPGTATFSGPVLFGSNVGTSGNQNNDYSGSTGFFKTSSGINVLNGSNTTIVGAASFQDVVILGPGAVTKSGSAAMDLSGSSGSFKTPTGAVTIGPGAITVSGIETHTAAVVLASVNKGSCTLNAATPSTCTATVASGCTPVCGMNGANAANTTGCAVSGTTLTATGTAASTAVVNFVCF